MAERRHPLKTAKNNKTYAETYAKKLALVALIGQHAHRGFSLRPSWAYRNHPAKVPSRSRSAFPLNLDDCLHNSVSSFVFALCRL